MRNLNQKGFSLIELMIVVAIIGILAAIAVPNFQKFQAKSRAAEAKSDLSAIYTAEAAFNTEYSQYFADFLSIGYTPTGTFRYHHGFSAAGAVNEPATYTGASGPAAGAAAVNFNTAAGATACGVAPTFSAGGCALIEAPTNPTTGFPKAGATSTTAAAFSAVAQADVTGSGTLDVWMIDNFKNLSNPQAGF
jgi:type IV pilus assembly protein PilA